jgi:hypothetical protein
VEKMNFDFFLTGEYYDMQQELHGRVAALPAELKRDWQAECVLSGEALQAHIKDLQRTVERLFDELSSPEQQRQYDVSDWLFRLLYTNRLEDTRLWWLGYWPARAWEHVVLMLPVKWFRERRP